MQYRGYVPQQTGYHLLSIFVAERKPFRNMLFETCYNFFIKGRCELIGHSYHILFADCLNICRAISSTSDCVLLLSDIDYVHRWCAAGFMQYNFNGIRTGLELYLYPGRRKFWIMSTFANFFMFERLCILTANFIFAVMSISFFHIHWNYYG
jgi:hypothetical protein